MLHELKKNGGKDRKNRSAVTSRFRRTAARGSLPTILEAMRDNKMLTFSYKPYWVEDDYVSSLYHVEPYALKVYALDRILDIDIEFEDFTLPADFNAAEFFGSCFGIIVGDEEPQLIRLKVDAFQSK